MCNPLTCISAMCKVICHLAKKDTDARSDLIFIALSIITSVGLVISIWCSGQQILFPSPTSEWFFYFSELSLGFFILSRILTISDKIFSYVNQTSNPNENV